MAGEPVLRSRLDLELREPEARLDAVLHSRLVHGSVPDYRHFLCDVYGILVPLEFALTYGSRLETSFLEPRLRAGLVARDLLALGFSGDEYSLLARRFDIVPFSTREEGLAWLYVTERVLAAQAGARALLPTSLAFATRYLASFDHGRWCDLVARLDATANANTLTIIQAATDRMCRWVAASPLARNAQAPTRASASRSPS